MATWTTIKVLTFLFAENLNEEWNAASTAEKSRNNNAQISNDGDNRNNNAHFGNNGDNVMEAMLKINNGQEKMIL